MMSQVDYWGLLAGVALFLFAMTQLETGLKALAGRSLAAYLRRQTNRRLRAVLSGIVSTAFLQSSSIVGLMVLAFTGAGLLNLTAALGIVFGSNLGTTLTGWIVTTLGFKFELARLSLPFIAIGGLTLSFGRGRWPEYGRALLGLGLLLLGLQFMKSSVETLEQLIDINDLAHLAPWQYLLFGTVVAAVIQSSSATMVINLSALHAGIIDLPGAAAIAIGADLGTTTTVMIGAVKGSAVKRQVAAGHVLFNLVTDAIAFLLRIPLLTLIAWAGIEDPLYALVAFHSLFNLMGLILFLPFTAQFAAWLETLFPAGRQQRTDYLGEVSRGVTAAGLQSVEHEAARLIARSLTLCRLAFEPALDTPPGTPPVGEPHELEELAANRFDELYRTAKTQEGELLEFAIGLQTDTLPENDSARLGQLLVVARETVHSAKAMKDIRHNLVELAQSDDDRKGRYASLFRTAMQAFLRDVYTLHDASEQPVRFEDLAAALQRASARHDSFHDTLYADIRANRVDESSISTLLNVNRELLVAQRCLLLAVGGFYLEPAHFDGLERLPD